MTLAEHQSLWDKIQRFEFDEPNATITFSKKLGRSATMVRLVYATGY